MAAFVAACASGPVMVGATLAAVAVGVARRSLNPFIVVLAALIGGTLLGVLGALLAIPSAATIQIAVREYLDYRRLAGAGSL